MSSTNRASVPGPDADPMPTSPVVDRRHVPIPAPVGVTTTVPVRWITVEAPMAELALLAPDQPGFRPNVTFERGRVEADLSDEEVVERTRAGLEDRAGTRLTAEHRTVVSGWPAAERTFRVDQPGSSLAGRQVVVFPPLAAGRGVRELVVVTAMAAVADIAVIDAALATVLDDLVITPSPA